jgi:hypothetical protein
MGSFWLAGVNKALRLVTTVCAMLLVPMALCGTARADLKQDGGHHRHHHHGAVPEIDPAAVAGALALLGGAF